MGVGKVPLGEVTVRMTSPPADPEQLDKLTVSTDQASRWMLAGGLQASRQAQLFPGRRVIWQLAMMLQQVLQDEWSCVANGKFQQASMGLTNSVLGFSLTLPCFWMSKLSRLIE